MGGGGAIMGKTPIQSNAFTVPLLSSVPLLSYGSIKSEKERFTLIRN